MIEQIWNNLESVLTLGTVAVSLYLFFNDPIRRWRFWGYRPTALLVLMDPEIKKVIVINSMGNWSFSQGGLYRGDLYDAVENIMERELNLEPHQYKLFYTKALGVAELTKSWQQRSPIFGGITLSNEIKGKAYVGCYIMLDSNQITSPGYGVDTVEVMDINEAGELFKKEVENYSKLDILNKALKEARYAMDLWERDKRS